MTDFEKALCESMGNLHMEDLDELLQMECEAPDRQTMKNIRKKTYQKLHKRKPWTAAGKWLAAAACMAMILLVWQKDTVYAELQKLFWFLPGVGIVENSEDAEDREPWYYSIVLEDDTEKIVGWNVILEKGYIKRQRETDSNKGKGEFVLKYSAERENGTDDLTAELAKMEIYCNGDKMSDGTSGSAKWRQLREARIGNGVIQKYGLWMDEYVEGACYELRLNEEVVFTFTLEELPSVALTGKTSDNNEKTVLTIGSEPTEEGLKVSYYPYYEEENIELTIPSPLRFTKTEDAYFYYEMGEQVIPYLSDGRHVYPAVSASLEEQDYSDIAQTVFDVPSGQEYTLHVPYMVAQEQAYDTASGRWSSYLERDFEDETKIMRIPRLKIGETKELDFRQEYERAAVEFVSVTRIPLEEMREIAGIEYEDGVGGYYLKLDVQNQKGWELLWMTFVIEGDFYGYHFVPHIDDGDVQGFLLVIGDPVWELNGSDELKLIAGMPGYLYETNFEIRGIME